MIFLSVLTQAPKIQVNLRETLEEYKVAYRESQTPYADKDAGLSHPRTHTPQPES